MTILKRLYGPQEHALKTQPNRIYYFDNLKFFLILLVVIGHVCYEFMGDSLIMKKIYQTIYSFHMPLFIFISGFFSKSAIKNDKLRLDRVFSYLSLYFLFRILNWSFTYFILQKPISFKLFEISGPAWYLLAMVFWLILTYVFQQIKPKFLFPLLFIFALGIGFDNTVRDFMIASRVIVFFPIFLFGYYCTYENIEKFLNKKHIRLLAIAVVIGFTILVFTQYDALKDLFSLFSGRNPYKVLKLTKIEGVSYRLLSYIIAALMSGAVMLLIPRCKMSIISVFGTRTLQVYILHFFVISCLTKAGVFSTLINEFSEKTWVAIFMGIGIVITFVLSLKIFEYPFKPFMHLKLNWLFKKQEEKQE